MDTQTSNSIAIGTGDDDMVIGSDTMYALVPVGDVVTVATSNQNEKGKKTEKYRGLQNQGATWYLNSLLQTLYMTPDFRSILYSWDYKEAEDKFSKEYCIPLQLQILFGCLQTSLRNKVSTKGLTSSFNWHSNEVSYQQDIQEFCRVLFNAIEESFKAIEKPWRINDLYQGAMSDYLKCTEWDYERINILEFLDLSLPIHDPWNNINNSSLQEALENYVKAEVLDEDNKYFCETCDKKVRAVKGLLFKKLPDTMIIQLNRFTFNEYGNATKINDKITFPYILNMNKFVNEEIADKIKQTDPHFQDLQQEQVQQEENVKDNSQQIEGVKVEDQPDKTVEDKQNVDLEAQDQDTKQAQELKEMSERQAMGEEDIDYSDPMNSISGPKKEFFYGNLDDQDQIANVVYNNQNGSTGGTAVPTMPPSHEARDDAEILKEIQTDIQNYIVQGEWVYYLYSVLIHSGGVAGGHYSAYIKSFEDDQWYHFNDSTVSEISIGDIEEMFGDGRSTRNAYLVIYKKLKLKESTENFEVDNDFRAVINEEEIPSYIKDEVEKDNEEFREEEKSRLRMEAERREREAHITLRIFAKSKANEESTEDISSNKIGPSDPLVKVLEKKIDFKNYHSLKMAHEEAYKVYELEKQGIKLEDTQIRTYNVGLKLLKNSFEDKQEVSLKELGIDLRAPIFIETKKSDEVFDSLPTEMIPLRYYLWKDSIQSLQEQYLDCHVLFVNQNNTVGELEQEIIVNMIEKGTLQEGQSFENVVLYTEKYFGGGVTLEEIDGGDDKTKSLKSSRVDEGCRVFVDFKIDSGDTTNWQKEFEKHANRSIIHFNNPHDGPVDQWANEEYKSFASTYENTLFMDKYQTILELKMQISERIGVDINEFRIMKAGIRYEEIRDLSQTLVEARMQSESKVFIELGKPKSSGSENVLIYEAHFNHQEDNELFVYSDVLFEISVDKECSVRELKQLISQEYSKKFLEGEPIQRDRIRIRDKGVERLGKVMRDGKLVKDYGLCRNKVYAMQLLDFEEVLTDPMEIIVVIREWIPNGGSGELTRKKEILLNRNMRYHEINEVLKNLGIIPEEENPEDYDIWKISSIMKFMVEDLPNQKWTPLTANGGFDQLETAPFYLRSDGHLMIIMNRRKFNQMPIIKDESASLAVGSIEDANVSKYDKFNIRSTAHTIPFIGGGRSNNAGVTIKVMDKKAQQEQEQKKQEEEAKRKEKEDQKEKKFQDHMNEFASASQHKEQFIVSQEIENASVQAANLLIEEANAVAPDLDFLGAFEDDDY